MHKDHTNKKIFYVTYGYEILTETVEPAKCDGRQVRVIEMKKPKGRKKYIAIFQETLDGVYCDHAVIG